MFTEYGCQHRKCCLKVIESFWIPSLQCGVLHKHTNEWIGLREEKGVYVFDSWISPAMTAWRKRSEVVSLSPFEENVYMTPVDFRRQENHP